MSGILLQEFFSKLGLDVDAQAFAKGELAVQGIRVALETMKRVVVGALNLAPQVADYAKSVDKMAQITGLSTDAVQELAFASRMGLDSFGHSVVLLNRNLDAAAKGSKEAAAAFHAVGVDPATAKDTDEVLTRIANHFQAMGPHENKAALAMKLFGRSGAEMIPFLNKGADGIERLREKSWELGLTLDASQIKQGKVAAEATRELGESWEGIKRQVGAGLLPALADLAQGMVHWLAENRKLIQSGIRTFIDALRFAFRALYFILRPIGNALLIVTKNLKLAGLVIGAYVLASLIAVGLAAVAAEGGFIKMGLAAMWSGLKAFGSWALAALPVLILTAVFIALGLVLEDIYVMLEGGDSLIGEMWDTWMGFLDNWLKDTDNDPWWLLAIKAFIYSITHIGDAWSAAVDFWREKFRGFADWIEARLQNIAAIARAITGTSTDFAKQMLYKQALEQGADPTEIAKRKMADIGYSSMLEGVDVDKFAHITPSVSASPQAIAGQALGGPMAFYTNVTVNAAQAGADEVVKMVKTQVEEAHKTMIREAQAGTH